MKSIHTITTIATSVVASSLHTQAAPPAIQPWSGYAVHDMKRPHPVKVETKAHTTTPAPADADVIFDGSNTDALTKAWKIVDGAMIASKGGNNQTKKHYGSCQVHIEWRVPKGREVEGQKGGNSGIFLMSKYEIQIQESHTNVTYADGQAGALYGQYPPLVNPSRPQGEWQSYDIMFTAPVYKDGKVATPGYITLLHNGVLVHNHQVLHGPSKHKTVTSYPDNHPEKAPILLQWHQDPIEFKNFWVRDLSKKSVATEPVKK